MTLVGGPPFAVSVSEIFALFGSGGLTLLRRETPAKSVPQRRELEQLLMFRAPSKLSQRRSVHAHN